MVPDWICKVFGKNWKTTASGVVFFLAGFVNKSPQLFHDWPWLIELAGYVMIVSGGAGLHFAKDKPTEQ